MFKPPESDTGKMSVEYRPSETAMATAILRFLAAMDKKGPDDLAEIFLPEDRKVPLRDPAIREWVIKNRMPPGMYEFMIARTALFDHVAKKALRENIPQIVFLGAGYDSRPYRFKEMIQDTRIFELDIQPTQQRKMALLQQAGVSIPDQLAFVSINFNTDHIGDILNRAGFHRNEKSLFVWEGVTYYFSAKIVDDTLSIIASHSPAGSLICFDYASRSPEISNDEGVKKIKESMKSHYPDEPTQFGIKNGEIESFLSSRGYLMVDHLNSKDMERRYLHPHPGSPAGKIPILFCIVLASLKAV
jgi:methyltransferase (TIGR00027 family)